MNYEKLRVRKLSPAEHIDSFDCGDEDLNSFILEEAPLYRKALLAVTYVVEDSESGKVLAYFKPTTRQDAASSLWTHTPMPYRST